MSITDPERGVSSPRQLTKVVSALIDLVDLGLHAKPGDALQILTQSSSFVGALLGRLLPDVDVPLVLVTATEERARGLQGALELFTRHGEGQTSVDVVWPLEHAPYRGVSPSRAAVMERIATLVRLATKPPPDVLIVTASALLDRVLQRTTLTDNTFTLQRGDRVDREALLSWLIDRGYHAVPTVTDPGTFAVRGSIIDLFCPLYEAPIRADFWGDELDTLRAFDPTSQRTTSDANLTEIQLCPARDIILTDATLQLGKQRLYALADELHIPSSRVRRMLSDLDAGVVGVGLEDLCPAFYETLDTVEAFISPDAIWLLDQPAEVEDVLTRRWDELSERAGAMKARGQDLVFSPEASYVPSDDVRETLARRCRARFTPLAVSAADPASSDTTSNRIMTLGVRDHQEIRLAIKHASERGEDEVLRPLVIAIKRWIAKDLVVILTAHSPGSVERLSGLLSHYDVRLFQPDASELTSLLNGQGSARGQVALVLADMGSGFEASELGLVVLDETDILGSRPKPRRAVRRADHGEAALASWRDLHLGDYVVHLMHGIGRYQGLVQRDAGGVNVEFVELTYAQGDKLYVPVDRLHLVSRYASAEGNNPRLDKLGGQSWQRTTKRVRKAVRDIADKLLAIYAERARQQGHAMAPPSAMYDHFVANFPWQETRDQLRAIDDVLGDMQRQRPMDRLVCGDVGFGKTEVALRAACLAVLDGKQVAVLVPTVVLAEQHRVTFEARFADLPIVVEGLTRTRTAQKAKVIRDGLASGQVDIVIGTHRLLSDKTAFKDLGLLIIDEEHRFGVTHKERIKGIKPDVDVLTLSATPIPRTLHMSMMTIRDISLIQTPPVDRMSINTVVARPTEEVFRDAIGRELKRGGQAYVVHNRVEDIERIAELISRIVPGARVAVGHGQMGRGELEKVMVRFIEGEVNVLVCTTIIESGLDIPNANTMLIDRADRFGLAQLYQLRGRIGRSSQRAYCYLLIPSPEGLSTEAAARISALQRFTELGSGFSIASHDLDIRGAGDLLGANQAGHIEAVGYEAFVSMLRDAVEALERGDTVWEPTTEPDLKLGVEARIPEDWLPDEVMRIRLYRQLAQAESTEALYALLESIADRFGAPPDPVRCLVETMDIRLAARRLGFSEIKYSSARLSLKPTSTGALTPEALTQIALDPSNGFTLTSVPSLVRSVTTKEFNAGLQTVRDSLRLMSKFATSQ